jgi:peptidoglycan/xylan/chitin deacetylase (PgdA/CDA1 family)
MGPLLKRLGFSAIAALDLEWLKKRSPIRVISPFHHLVSDQPVPYIEKLYAFKNTLQFEADLDWLLTHFRPLTLQEVIAQTAAEAAGHSLSQPPGFLICFDDGLRWVYETVAPILLRKGVPAAFFINSAFVDNKDIFYNFKKGLILDHIDRKHNPGALAAIDQLSSPHPPPSRARAIFDKKILSAAGELFNRRLETAVQLRVAIRSINYLNKQITDEVAKILELDQQSFWASEKPFMSTVQIKELTGKGFAIGSHSIDHPLYALIPPGEQLRQTRESTQWITDTLGLPYKTFAFPHVDTGVKDDFFRELVEGPQPELDLVWGNTTGMLERHPRVIHRFIGENPAIPIDRMVKSVLAYSAGRRFLGKSYVKR